MERQSLGGRAAKAALVALTVADIAIPSAAEAGRRTRTAVGVGVAAGVLGLAIGAAAANARDREVVYGDIRLRRVRIYD